MLAVPVPGDPLAGQGGHLVGRLHAPGAEVEALVEAGVEVVGGVPLGERADGGGEDADVPQRAHPAVPGGRRLEAPVPALRGTGRWPLPRG